jgi:hypothetical protein
VSREKDCEEKEKSASQLRLKQKVIDDLLTAEEKTKQSISEQYIEKERILMTECELKQQHIQLSYQKLTNQTSESSLHMLHKEATDISELQVINTNPSEHVTTKVAVQDDNGDECCRDLSHENKDEKSAEDDETIFSVEGGLTTSVPPTDLIQARLELLRNKM